MVAVAMRCENGSSNNGAGGGDGNGIRERQK